MTRVETDDPRAQYRSSEYRRSQTPRNLIGAVVICLALAGVLAFFLPRNESPAATPSVDVASVAANASGAAGTPLLVPALPAGWSSNSARWEAASGGSNAVWNVSYRTDTGTQISAKQAVSPGSTWTYAAMGNRDPDGTTTIGGSVWDRYGPSETDQGVRAGLAISFPAGGSSQATSLVLYGSANDADLARLAAALLAAAGEAGLPGPSAPTG